MKEYVDKYEAIKIITEYKDVFDKSVAKRILTQMDSVQSDEQQKISEWNMFLLLSSAWYGKQCYFEEDNDNEIIYSKFSGKLMSKEDAIKEFIREISE